ncbi:MAG: BMP family ABC transporter substrate-binding protein [Spirochaetales bacterium]|nr:BMP family ABC transporter substrate-binding protein [Spirochaetales bacterium]
MVSRNQSNPNNSTEGAMKATRKALAVLAFFLLAATLVTAGGKGEEEAEAQAKTIKAGFIYVGPVGDYGWSHAHDVGRKYVVDRLDWLETVYVESVPEGDAARIIDRLVVEENCDVVFTTSFGYMDDTVAAGAKHPDQLFMHCSGFKNAENVGTYFAELYQMYYLNGMMAAALTKSNKIGYVGAFPTPEVVRHIDAYALGVKAVNPDARVHVRWIFSWYDPAKAREAAEALVADGVDCLAFTEDSPAVIEVGQEHAEKGEMVYTFSHYSPMEAFGPDSAVSGQLVDWGIMYEKILEDIYNGTWSNEDLWWLAKEKAALLGGSLEHEVNPKFVDDLKGVSVSTPDLGRLNVYELVMKRYEQMKQGRDVFDPFAGPVSDNKGAVRIPAGRIGTKAELLSIDYYVDNIVGDVPK